MIHASIQVSRKQICEAFSRLKIDRSGPSLLLAGSNPRQVAVDYIRKQDE